MPKKLEPPPFPPKVNPNPNPEAEQAKLNLTGNGGDRRVSTEEAGRIYRAEIMSLEKDTDKAGFQGVRINFKEPEKNDPLWVLLSSVFDIQLIESAGLKPDEMESRRFYPVQWVLEYDMRPSPFGLQRNMISIKHVNPVTFLNDWGNDPEKVHGNMGFKQQAMGMVKRGKIGLIADHYVEQFVFGVFGIKSWDECHQIKMPFTSAINQLGKAIHDRSKAMSQKNSEPQGDQPVTGYAAWKEQDRKGYFAHTGETMRGGGVPQEDFESVRDMFLTDELADHPDEPSHKMITWSVEDSKKRFDVWFKNVWLNLNWQIDPMKKEIAAIMGNRFNLPKGDPRYKQMFEAFLASESATSLDILKAERGCTHDVVLQLVNTYLDTLPQPEPAQTVPAVIQFPTQKPDMSKAAPILTETKTLMGIPVCDIPWEMNQKFPDAAYEEIPNGPMKGYTDLSFDFVRDRFDVVFGTQGFGWKIEPHTVLGSVQHSTEEKTTKGQNSYNYTNHIVTLTCHILKYRVVLADGSIQWEECSPLSDSDNNTDLGYAYRGAFTSLLKQYLRSFGGINHIMRGEYTHIEAKKNSQAKPKNQKAS